MRGILPFLSGSCSKLQLLNNSIDKNKRRAHSITMAAVNFYAGHKEALIYASAHSST
jgi:hypothetical protein